MSRLDQIIQTVTANEMREITVERAKQIAIEYAKEVAIASLEKASKKLVEILREKGQSFTDQQSITNPENIVL